MGLRGRLSRWSFETTQQDSVVFSLRACRTTSALFDVVHEPAVVDSLAVLCVYISDIGWDGPGTGIVDALGYPWETIVELLMSLQGFKRLQLCFETIHDLRRFMDVHWTVLGKLGHLLRLFYGAESRGDVRAVSLENLKDLGGVLPRRPCGYSPGS